MLLCCLLFNSELATEAFLSRHWGLRVKTKFHHQFAPELFAPDAVWLPAPPENGHFASAVMVSSSGYPELSDSVTLE